MQYHPNLKKKGLKCGIFRAGPFLSVASERQFLFCSLLCLLSDMASVLTLAFFWF